MTVKPTGLIHKIAIQLHLVAKSCTICSSRSRRPVRKLLDAPSYKHALQPPQLPYDWRWSVEIVTGASWNIHRHVFYYDQVARLPLSRAVKSFREFYSHTVYVWHGVVWMLCMQRISVECAWLFGNINMCSSVVNRHEFGVNWMTLRALVLSGGGGGAVSCPEMTVY
jgi:hypothetical protein